MKKWKKWTLGILVLIVIGVLVILALMWSSINILKGTEGLDGNQEAIPSVKSGEPVALVKGASDWTSWLGAAGDKRSTVTGIKTDWSQGLKKQWEINFLCQGKVSAAWSAPVVQGNHLVVCGRDSVSDLIFCLNAADGSLIWQASYPAKAVDNHGTGSRATPAIDNDRVYTFGRSSILACWNLIDGKEIWRQNLSELGGKEPTWGHSSSPLIWGDLVIVQGGGDIRTIAFNKMTGEIAWKSGSGLAGYTALTIMNLAGKPVLLAFHGKGLAGLDPENGHELWNVPWETSYDVNATTPAVIENRVFITSGYNVGCALLEVDSTRADVLWKNVTIASVHSDPYIIDGFVYGYSGDSFQNRGKFKCVDLKDGVEKWTTNEMGWGTCTYADGHLICCDIKGNLFLMKPGPNEFIKVAALKKALGDVQGPVWTMPVIANGKIYLRFKQRLVCYDLVN